MAMHFESEIVGDVCDSNGQSAFDGTFSSDDGMGVDRCQTAAVAPAAAPTINAIPKKKNRKSPFIRNRPNVRMMAVDSQIAEVDIALAVSLPIAIPFVD